ncbi:hypothetical protein EYD10_12483 [Varanus komodoensis]|nr:hypothetical protein EYD10_12483 [Varanus komodoensis]
MFEVVYTESGAKQACASPAGAAAAVPGQAHGARGSNPCAAGVPPGPPWPSLPNALSERIITGGGGHVRNHVMPWPEGQDETALAARHSPARHTELAPVVGADETGRLRVCGQRGGCRPAGGPGTAGEDRLRRSRSAPPFLLADNFRYTCDICGKKYKYYSCFQEHRDLHAVDDPYDQAMIAKEEVKEEDPEPFQKIGPSMTYRVCNLKTGNYTCEFCGKQYKYYTPYQEHVALHAPISEYPATARHWAGLGPGGSGVRGCWPRGGEWARFARPAVASPPCPLQALGSLAPLQQLLRQKATFWPGEALGGCGPAVGEDRTAATMQKDLGTKMRTQKGPTSFSSQLPQPVARPRKGHRGLSTSGWDEGQALGRPQEAGRALGSRPGPPCLTQHSWSRASKKRGPCPCPGLGWGTTENRKTKARRATQRYAQGSSLDFRFTFVALGSEWQLVAEKCPGGFWQNVVVFTGTIPPEAWEPRASFASASCGLVFPFRLCSFPSFSLSLLQVLSPTPLCMNEWIKLESLLPDGYPARLCVQATHGPVGAFCPCRAWRKSQRLWLNGSKQNRKHVLPPLLFRGAKLSPYPSRGLEAAGGLLPPKSVLIAITMLAGSKFHRSAFPPIKRSQSPQSCSPACWGGCSKALIIGVVLPCAFPRSAASTGFGWDEAGFVPCLFAKESSTQGSVPGAFEVRGEDCARHSRSACALGSYRDHPGCSFVFPSPALPRSCSPATDRVAVEPQRLLRVKPGETRLGPAERWLPASLWQGSRAASRPPCSSSGSPPPWQPRLAPLATR